MLNQLVNILIKKALNISMLRGIAKADITRFGLFSSADLY
jgi:hypothetical protein